MPAKFTEFYLDYDESPLAFVLEDMRRLDAIYNFLGYSVYESSEGNYHARIRLPSTFDYAVAVMKVSKCSEDYKKLVEDIGRFTIRISAKRSGEGIKNPPVIVMTKGG